MEPSAVGEIERERSELSFYNSLGLLEAVVSNQIPQISHCNSHTETKKSTIPSIWSACPSSPASLPPPRNPFPSHNPSSTLVSINSTPCKRCSSFLQWAREQHLWIDRCTARRARVETVMCAYQRDAYWEFLGILSTSSRSCRKSLQSAVFLEVGILPMELCRPPFVKPAWRKSEFPP